MVCGRAVWGQYQRPMIGPTGSSLCCLQVPTGCPMGAVPLSETEGKARGIPPLLFQPVFGEGLMLMFLVGGAPEEPLPRMCL